MVLSVKLDLLCARMFWMIEVEIPLSLESSRTLTCCSFIASNKSSEKRKSAYSLSNFFFCFVFFMMRLNVVILLFFIISPFCNSCQIVIHSLMRFFLFVFWHFIRFFAKSIGQNNLLSGMKKNRNLSGCGLNAKILSPSFLNFVTSFILPASPIRLKRMRTLRFCESAKALK